MIWDWRHADAPAEARPSASRERRVGTLQGLVAAAVGLLLMNYWSRVVGSVVLVVSAVILLSALASPLGLYAGVQRLFLALGNFMGRLLTWIVMPFVFYVLFSPFGLVFRRGRRDRLKRFFEPDDASYWEPHTGSTAATSSPELQF